MRIRYTQKEFSPTVAPLLIAVFGKEGAGLHARLIGTPEFCCNEMRFAWSLDNKFIGFGDFNQCFDINQDVNVNVYLCRPYAGGAIWESMPIRHCPFCAEEIIRIRV